MPIENERRINEVQNNPTLSYGVRKDNKLRARPIELDGNGNVTATLYKADGTPYDNGDGNLPVKIVRQDLTVVTATIPINTALSGEVDIDGASIGAMLMPGAWTAADITFQIREWSNGTYYDLYDENGSEVVVTVAATRSIPLPPELIAARYFRIRSGTTGTPVNQAAERIIKLVLKG